MNKLLLALLLAFTLLSSCGSSKNYTERADADRALVDAIKQLGKNSNDAEALAAVPVLYNTIKQEQLATISRYRNSTDPKRFDVIIKAYQDLQNAYSAVLGNTAAFKMVTPESFATSLLEAKESAAFEVYNSAESYAARQGRDNAKQAYTLYKRADRYVPGYKDSRAKMEQAFQNAIVHVVINPVEDNSYFFNSGWGNTGYNYSNQYFQESLVRELQNSNNSNRYAANFYTDWEARRQNVIPDWVVDLRLRDMSIPYPITNNYQRQVSNTIQEGRDTSGKPIYKTVYATLNISRSSFNARASMEMNIRDLQTNRNISFRSFSNDYRWQEESGNYTGDRRALSNNDWATINNNNFNSPRREDVLESLYRNIYPQVRNEIANRVDW